MRVDSWGVRVRYADRQYNNLVPLLGPVSKMPGFEHNRVATRCGSNENSVDDFAVAISMTSQHATMAGVWVYYRSDGSTRRTFAQYDIALCSDTSCVSR